MKVTRIHERIYRITTPFGEGGTVFLYLVKGDRIALIDTGAADSPREVLQPALAEIGIAVSNVDLILNTHAHLDHAGGNLDVKRVSNARIHVHSADLFMAQSTEAQVEFMTAPLRALDFPAEMLEHRIRYVAKQAGTSAGADVLLSDGDTVDLGAGVALRVVHNPGHTPGSASYYWESEGALLTGDAIQGQGSRLGGYPLYFNAPDYRRSLVKLSGLDLRLLCMSHAYFGSGAVNNPTRVGAEGKEFILSALQTADAIQRVAAEVVKRMPGASKRELAVAAASELIYHVPSLLVRQTGLPGAGGPVLLTHINSAIDGTYPE